MFGIENYSGFIACAIILNLTPGADTLYILTRSLSSGRIAGVTAVAGILSGCLIHVLCAAFGLSLILSSSGTVFNLVKWAGAGYLIYLGTRTLMDRSFLMPSLPTRSRPPALWTIYRQGVLTNVLNPKVALFFLSFLPQFIRPDEILGPLPFLILGGTFIFTGTIWCLFLAWAAGRMTLFFRRKPWAAGGLQKISGLLFIGFGIRLILAEK